MLGLCFLSLYFTCLLMFSFVTQLSVYCMLLVVSALSVAGYIYSVVGFSWYLALFCLVYVGGVYVLFVFVSVYGPNPFSLSGGSLLAFLGFFVTVWGIFGSIMKVVPAVCESSEYLCSFYEGFSYCVFCLVLVVGFMCVSIMMSERSSFFR
uniref:NADH dehydrogenase subunit 6 n=1 Tax=Paramphistomum cervi TaxID=762801 RepID=V5K9A2_PARCE|nr:NADH dehydrogenase subunit 6 [Paramphistomum cervi]AGV52546.1 NADH dehydrogenase subunit 6 [Paramphistomum cervi]ALC75062.1 NADH dehydrogenase subunit 6 [Paramphistomum cervi]